MIPAPRPVLYAALAALVALLPTAGPVLAQPSAAARFTRLAGDVREADGHLYDARDDTGRTMDAAQIVQPPSGPYLAVYHTALEDGRFHAAVATSTDLRTWHRRHDFGPGTSQPSLAATEDSGGDWVLAYEKDPDNHLELRSYPGLTALLTGRPERSFDAPRTLSRCAEGTPTSLPRAAAPSNSPATTATAATPTASSPPSCTASAPGAPTPTSGSTTPYGPAAPAATSATAPPCGWPATTSS